MSRRRAAAPLVLFLVLSLTSLSSSVAAFLFHHPLLVPPNTDASATSSRSSSRLFGLVEWRQSFAAPPDVGRPILMLPFAASEMLVQGQSTTIILKEGRFYDLFQDCIDDYQSIVGMAIMGDDGLLKHMPLCEVQDFDVDAGYRGKVTISVTLRAVGRAKLVELTQMKPIMEGICTEMVDEHSFDASEVALANELVRDIESNIRGTNGMEGGGVSLQRRYEEAVEFALDTYTQGYGISSGTLTETAERTMRYPTAVSWAVLTIVSKPSLQKAFATTSITDRLKIGLKALLDLKYETRLMINEPEEDVGFE